MKTNTIELYIHIPFCKSKCRYCDFCSFRAEEETIHAYLGKLKEELIFWGKKLAARDVVTVFIGGGTPSYLRREDIQMICETIFEHFHICEDAEITIEANPGTVDLKKLCTYRENGINRISFGLQSTVKEELEYLGRIHTYEEFLQSFDWARQAGFLNINVDLMSAVPKQTLTSYEENLRKIAKLSPEHISAYSLIIEEGTPFYEKYRENPPVDEDTDRQMYDLTKEILGRHGYHRYEISNYAKEGQECIHNLKYWQGGDYLGLGLGAASCMEHERWSNARGLTDYEDRICRGQKPVEQTEELGEEEQKAEFMFLGLRCMEGVSAERFEKKFHQSVEERYGKVLHKYENMGLMRLVNGNWQLTEQGIDVSNHIFADFLPE